MREDITGDPDAMNVGDTLAERYLLERVIGRGGMGVVYKAKDIKAQAAADRNPYVAIKLLNSDFKKHPEAFIALEREASKSQTLRHKNIVSIFDFDKDGDTPFITMELLEGQELAELLTVYPTGLPQDLALQALQSVDPHLPCEASDRGVSCTSIVKLARLEMVFDQRDDVVGEVGSAGDPRKQVPGRPRTGWLMPRGTPSPLHEDRRRRLQPQRHGLRFRGRPLQRERLPRRCRLRAGCRRWSTSPPSPQLCRWN